jgi:NADPH:quinone reductase-like Zn-dependent oxidoreductase
MDLAGTIDAVGEDVDDRLHVGEQVIALVLPFAETRGAYTTSIVVDQRSVVHAPGGWTMPEAATLLLNGVTATLALDAVALPAGDVVGITGASGAVGRYALALAKKRNLVVVADSRPGSEQSFSEHGADVVIDRGAGFATKVRERFPEGLDGLIDTASLNEAALPAVADNGAIASLKGWSGPGERGIRVEPLSAFGAVTDTSLLQQVRDHAADRTLQPHVAEVIPAERAAEAHERLAHGGLNGRLVLDLSNLYGANQQASETLVSRTGAGRRAPHKPHNSPR